MKDCGCPECLGKCDYRYKSKCKNTGLCGYQIEPDIKIVYENDWCFEITNNNEIIASRKLYPLEIAELFDIDINDLLSDKVKIGLIKISDEEKEI